MKRHASKISFFLLVAMLFFYVYLDRPLSFSPFKEKVFFNELSEKNENNWKGLIYHSLPQQSLGYYSVYLPKNYFEEEMKNKKYAICLVLHGRGGSETEFSSVLDGRPRGELIYCVPRAPYPRWRTFFEQQHPGWSAWPQILEENFLREKGNFKDDSEVQKLIELYIAWIDACLEDLKKNYRTAPGKIVVVGHSQGGGFAHLFARYHPEKVKADFSFAGFVYGGIPSDASVAEIFKKNKVFPVLVHCKKDGVVPVSVTENWAAYYRKYKLPFQVTIAEEGGHLVSSEAARELKKFIETWCLKNNAIPH
jgi:predicted esterase